MTTDLATVEELWHSHHARLYRLISYHVHDYEDARDLLSSVYLRAIVAFNNGHGCKEHAGGWIFAIARSAIADYWRYRQKRQTPVEYDMLEEWLAYEDTHHDAMRHIVSDTVRTAIVKLNANQEDVVTLRMEGYTFDEIGEAMHTNGNAAKSACMRAYANLRVRLEEFAP